MSLYNVVVIGTAGTHTLLVSGFFPHMHEARQEINEWASNEYAGSYINVDVTFLNHSDQIFVTDLKNSNYDKVIILR